MADQSHLDQRYFIDDQVYNCPFCNRRHVTYTIRGTRSFDWTNSKECHAYFIKCGSCQKRSMHLSWENFKTRAASRDDGDLVYEFKGFNEDEDVGEKLDNAFFHSVPSSFFVTDDRVPKKLRELMTEAEGCLKGNFLTGASACARKMVYELAVLEDAEGDEYEDRLKSLKAKLPAVDSTYFDTLLTIQRVTSTKVHENAYDGWEAKHLRVILAALSEALHEIYVAPKIRQERREGILALKDEVTGEKAQTPSPPQSGPAKPSS